MLATMNPTSPTPSSSTGIAFGENTPNPSTSKSCFVAMSLILAFGRSMPSMTRTTITTPRYASYQESKISAFSGALGSPRGGWKRSTMASRISVTPVPSFALARIEVLLSRPMMSSIWRLHSSGCALGRSILLMTGMISRLSSTARYAFASVCASTPWVASTSSSAPSQAASERVTS